MKVPGPDAFEDGDLRTFLEEFEDVMELVGIRSDRGKLTAIRALLKGLSPVVLDAAQRGPEKMEWATAKDAVTEGSPTVIDKKGMATGTLVNVEKVKRGKHPQEEKWDVTEKKQNE
ncbi:unnamed protein product [Echinostoma caproni]|uniref:Reverse transcriptase domain-containing protein n=1 Tax=Echinostoma caproni TaxID=27848 RepID=A0A183A8N0_9TREM|nr:unnamed protein product [Echinostoma caproni]